VATTPATSTLASATPSVSTSATATPATSPATPATATPAPGPEAAAAAVPRTFQVGLVLPFVCGLALAALVIVPLRFPELPRRIRAQLRFGVEPSPGGLVLELEPLDASMITALDRGPGAAGAGDSSGPWFLLWIVNTSASPVQLWHGDRAGDEVSVEVIPVDGQPGPPADAPPPGWSPTTTARPLSATWLGADERIGLPVDLGPWLAGRAPGRYWVVVTRLAQGDPRLGLDGPARSARTPITVKVE
jgi:hypothetical protein